MAFVRKHSSNTLRLLIIGIDFHRFLGIANVGVHVPQISLVRCQHRGGTSRHDFEQLLIVRDLEASAICEVEAISALEVSTCDRAGRALVLHDTQHQQHHGRDRDQPCETPTGRAAGY